MQTTTLSYPHNSWNSINHHIESSDYKRTRKLVHQAAQIVAATSRSLLPLELDDEQSDLFWMPDRNMLAGRPIGYNAPHQIAFDIINFRFASLDRQGHIISDFKLAGKNTVAALEWLNNQIASNISITLELPYELPFVPMSKNRIFDSPDLATLNNICKWLSNASLVLGPLSLKLTESTLPICKPDSLDMKCFSTVLESQDEVQKIELGMSLGDSDYPLPYFYTIPHPAPKMERLPYYQGKGKWHTFPWIGVVLTSDELIKQEVNVPDQQQLVEEFFKSSYEICLKLF